MRKSFLKAVNNLKVILTQDVKGLGTKEAVVEVAEGYARNYLLPRGLAVEASQGRIRDLKHRKEIAESKKEKAKKDALKLAEKLEKIEVKIVVRCGEGGKLFGAVTSREVADALARDFNIKINRKQIEFKDPIKTLGRFPLTAKLHPGVQAKFSVVVVAEQP